MIKFVCLFLLTLFTQFSFGQAEIKAMFYNLLNFSSAPPINRLDILNSILSSYEPDLFMVSEVESQKDAKDILEESFHYTSANIAQSPFLFNTSGASLIHQMVYYDADKLELSYTNQIETNVRSINHYSFKLNTNSDVNLEVFVAHFKASQGFENERYFEAKQFIEYIENFPSNTNILFAGDLNMYSSAELGFQTLLNGTSYIKMVDPIDMSGDWNNNSTFAGIHTQSTRTSNAGFEDFGAGGGLDDRFDIMLISDVLNSKGNSITYIENSYKAWGNNGNCYNDNINSMDCDGEYNQQLREWLYQMSDHLPVVMNFKINDQFLSTSGVDFENSFSFTSGNIISQRLDLNFSSELLAKTARIYNTLGQEVLNFDVSNTEISIDTSSLANGLYFIRINQLPIIKKFYIHN